MTAKLVNKTPWLDDTDHDLEYSNSFGFSFVQKKHQWAVIFTGKVFCVCLCEEAHFGIWSQLSGY